MKRLSLNEQAYYLDLECLYRAICGEKPRNGYWTSVKDDYEWRGEIEYVFRFLDRLIADMKKNE